MVTFIAKINTGSKKEQITIQENGDWHIKIHAKPIKGAANEYLIEFLSNTFQLRKSSICIKKGLTSPIKKIQLDIDEIQWKKIISTLTN